MRLIAEGKRNNSFFFRASKKRKKSEKKTLTMSFVSFKKQQKNNQLRCRVPFLRFDVLLWLLHELDDVDELVRQLWKYLPCSSQHARGGVRRRQLLVHFLRRRVR